MRGGVEKYRLMKGKRIGDVWVLVGVDVEVVVDVCVVVVVGGGG